MAAAREMSMSDSMGGRCSKVGAGGNGLRGVGGTEEDLKCKANVYKRKLNDVER